VRDLSIRVNGQERRSAVADNELLLDLLREKLEVRSVKASCWRGECGLCSVLLNGRLVKSCLVLAVEADGGELATVEGLGDGAELNPIQRAFVEHGALQCGFCTPAFVLACHQLLSTNPNPTAEELDEALGGLVCRCGTYNQIREAVSSASKFYSGASSEKLVKRVG